MIEAASAAATTIAAIGSMYAIMFIITIFAAKFQTMHITR